MTHPGASRQTGPAPRLTSPSRSTDGYPGWAQLRLSADGEVTLSWLEQRLREQLGFELISCRDLAIERSRGKTRTHAKIALRDGEDLAFAYTPDVGRVAQHVAIVTDGSAVLGLGNLGPALASAPLRPTVA